MSMTVNVSVDDLLGGIVQRGSELGITRTECIAFLSAVLNCDHETAMCLWEYFYGGSRADAGDLESKGFYITVFDCKVISLADFVERYALLLNEVVRCVDADSLPSDLSPYLRAQFTVIALKVVANG